MRHTGFRAGSVLLAVTLGGCAAHATYRAGTTQVSGGGVASTQLQVSSDSKLGAAIIIGIMAADGLRYYRVEPDGSRKPLGERPDPDPARRINVQDCTQPVSPRAGNLMCR